MEIRENFESDEENSIDNEQDDNQEEVNANLSDDENIIDFNNNIGEEHVIKYNPNDYKLDDIIEKLMQLKIIKKSNVCTVCNLEMKLVNTKDYKDKKCWRCKKNIPYKHDNKINIRSNSILADMRSDIRLLFFIIFINFAKKLSINSIYKNCLEFSKDLKIETISKKHIGKILPIVRFYIMKTLHKFWKDNLMGEEPGLDGKSRIEIDESKIITIGNTVRWMFGLVDRAKYDIRIFFVNDNRQKEIKK